MRDRREEWSERVFTVQDALTPWKRGVKKWMGEKKELRPYSNPLGVGEGEGEGKGDVLTLPPSGLVWSD